MPSQRYKTAMEFIGDFKTLDTDAMLSRRTDDCTHSFLPASLSMPEKDNAGIVEHVNRLKEVLSSFPVTAKEVMEDENKNMVIVHATSVAHFHDEVKDDGISEDDWLYKGEYIYILTMNEEGDKVRKVVEFVDSKGTESVLGLVKRAMSNSQRAGEKNV